MVPQIQSRGGMDGVPLNIPCPGCLATSLACPSTSCQISSLELVPSLRFLAVVGAMWAHQPHRAGSRFSIRMPGCTEEKKVLGPGLFCSSPGSQDPRWQDAAGTGHE